MDTHRDTDQTPHVDATSQAINPLCRVIAPKERESSDGRGTRFNTQDQRLYTRDSKGVIRRGDPKPPSKKQRRRLACKR